MFMFSPYRNRTKLLISIFCSLFTSQTAKAETELANTNTQLTHVTPIRINRNQRVKSEMLKEYIFKI